MSRATRSTRPAWSGLAGVACVVLLWGCDAAPGSHDGAPGSRDARPAPSDAAPSADGAADARVDTPDSGAACAPIPGVAYTASTVVDPAWHNAAADPGANVTLLPYRVAQGQSKGIVHYDGPADGKCPKLTTIFADHHAPQITGVYQLALWDWDRKAPGDFVSDPPVSLVGFASVPGEVVQVPSGGYDIGEGYQVLVLYADPRTIMLRYTREDNLKVGYAIYLQGICVEPTLLALYEKQAAAGRKDLPRLRGDEPVGRAVGDEVLVAIRDCGTLLDPRGDAFHAR